MFPIPLPWLIVGVLVSLFGTYQVGHHYGWLERDNDMKIAIAQKNEESRKTEQKLTEELNQNATKLLRLPMLSIKRLLPLLLPIVLASCASAPPVTYKPPQVPPLPPQIQKQPASLTDRLTQLLMPKEQPSKPSQK